MKEIIDQMNETINALTDTALRLRKSGTESVNARCDYEDAKNELVLKLRQEEIDDPKKKRTDAVRQSVYRSMLKEERKNWLGKESNYETDKILFKGLQSKINALQTVARLTETELKMGTDVQDKLDLLASEILDIKERFSK